MDKDKNKTKGGSHAAKKPRKSADTPAAARTRRKTESAPAAPRTPRRRKKSRIGIMVAAAIIALAVRIAASYAMKGVFGDLTIAYAEALSWALMLLLYAARLMQRRMSEKNNKAPEEKA